MHSRKGILNIDVVSFERLAYKVFEELGGGNRPVLDDTGKNLIVRRVLEKRRKSWITLAAVLKNRFCFGVKIRDFRTASIWYYTAAAW